MKKTEEREEQREQLARTLHIHAPAMSACFLSSAFFARSSSCKHVRARERKADSPPSCGAPRPLFSSLLLVSHILAPWRSALVELCCRIVNTRATRTQQYLNEALGGVATSAGPEGFLSASSFAFCSFSFMACSLFFWFSSMRCKRSLIVTGSRG